MTTNGCLNNMTGCYAVCVVQTVHFHTSPNKPSTFGHIYSAMDEVREGSTDSSGVDGVFTWSASLKALKPPERLHILLGDMGSFMPQ